MYRLANDMVVRLPRITRAADQVDTEQRWLPRLAPHLPLQVPVPLGLGAPGEGFPMPWSVYAWLDGENAFDRPGSRIDFGIVGIGDPAYDPIPAWYLFSGETRELFRSAADIDDITWARGRGWALCLGLGSEHYYRTKNPALATVGRRAMFEALAEIPSTG
jgi:aminoglycoside phosphotransferase (APT) family kinase protein